jgi:hypothetical protein
MDVTLEINEKHIVVHNIAWTKYILWGLSPVPQVRYNNRVNSPSVTIKQLVKLFFVIAIINLLFPF